jgi:glycosyltransferase involved in cell wall biosynthesis
MPKISVIMSCYNHDKFVGETIESVLNQSFKDFEFLIIDDNSTDKTYDIVNSFNDPRIKAFRNEKNFGMVFNTNSLIKKSNGEYIAIINSDDSWLPEKLQKQLDFLENNVDYGACFTLANIIDEDNKIIKNNIQDSLKYLELDRFNFLNYFFFYNNPLCYPSVLMRKNILEKTGFFNPAFIILLDIDMWIKICLAGFEIKILNENLTNFRILKNGGNLSGKNHKTIIRNSLEFKEIYKSYQNMKNYNEFIKIFPEYEKISIANKNLAGYYYLVDFCYRKYFIENSKPSQKNIKNFLIEFIHQKSFEDANFFEILGSELGINFREYLGIVDKYPTGVLISKSKVRSKIIRKIIYFFSLVLLSIFIINYF